MSARRFAVVSIGAVLFSAAVTLGLVTLREVVRPWMRELLMPTGQ